jgi:serine/threonine protein kinase
MKALRERETDTQTLSGYDRLEVLGEGAFGTVFRARQVSTEQNVIIKILRIHEASGGGDAARRIARFRLEARLCATLRHPQIVRLLDVGTTDAGCPFVVFEDAGGVTLRELLRSRGALSAFEAGRLMAQVLDALCFAHTKGVVHRDLKPSNIIVCGVGAEQQAKVLEFGIGGLLWDFRERDCQSLALAREVLGNPSYEAPEQLRGEPPIPASDLYAWGLTFLECLSGDAVMTGNGTAEVLKKQLGPDEIQLPPGVVSHPLSALLERVLRKDPRERAGEAGLLLEELGSLDLSDLDSGPRSSTVSRSRVAPREGVAAGGEDLWDPAASFESRRLTVLCCNLSVVPPGGLLADSDALDDLQRIQHGLCLDIVSKHGGTLAGTLADHMVFFFGYPKSTDTDARVAVHAALELASASRSCSASLVSQEGVSLEFRAGIHSGLVTVRCDSAPSGVTLGVAFRLESKAPKGTILVSRDTQELLRNQQEFVFEKSELTFEPFCIDGYVVRERLPASAPAPSATGSERERKDRCEGELGTLRMGPNTLLTQALMGMRGWADGEIRASIEQSCQLLRGAQNKQYVVATMWQVMVYHYVASNRRELRQLTEELVRYAETWGDLSLVVAAETFMGLVWHGEGHYEQAAASFEEVRRLYQPVRDGVHSEMFGLDTRVWATSTLALVEWFRADAAKAYRYADEAVVWAKAIGHVPSVCVALLGQAQLMHYARDTERATGVVAELSVVADEFGFPGHQGYSHIMQCWLSRDAEGAEAICARLESRGCTAALSYYWSIVADIHLVDGRFDEALRAVDVCLGLSRKSQAYYYLPELHRLRGECLMQRQVPDVAQATRSFQQAAELATVSGMVRTESEALLARSRIQMSRHPEEARSRIEALVTSRAWQHLEL